MKKLKSGDIVYLKDVGFPFDRAEPGHDSWEGASCVVLETETGDGNRYVSVAPLFPMRVDHGHIMTECIFSPECVVLEDRPWLKNNLKNLLKLKKKLFETAQLAVDMGYSP